MNVQIYRGDVVYLEIWLLPCDLYCCHVPFSISTGALGSPGLLSSCSIITISLHITIILIILTPFYICNSTLQAQNGSPL